MSILLMIIYVFSAVFVFSQIGGKLTARNALTWLLVFALLGLAVFLPDRLLPLARILGVQLVSNLLFAGLILFLVFQSMHESAFTTRISRRIRDLVSTLGADAFSPGAGAHDCSERTLVIIPCFNEGENLPQLLEAIVKFQDAMGADGGQMSGGIDFCIIDDGSSDGSRSQLRSQNRVPFILLPTNVGVSAVTLTGFKVALAKGYARAAQLDADGQHPIVSLSELIRCQKEKSSDLVIGSRFVHGRSADESTTGVRMLGSTLICWALKLFSLRTRITDPTSGFRVYSRRAFAFLAARMPDEYPEPESIAILLASRFSVDEVSVRMLPRTRGVSSLSGWKGPKFMLKVFGSLVGLRLRAWFG
jgi:hypothetical protein